MPSVTTYVYPFAGHRVLHLSTILASFILRTFLVSYSGVLENLGKAFKLTYAKPLRCIAWPAKGYKSQPCKNTTMYVKYLS
jgi:hypothetical protein